jgi:hypothetical protein
VPMALAGDDDAYPVEFRICTDSDNLTGFVDSEVPPGASYEYRFVAVAEVSDQGNQESPVVVRQIDVIGTLVAVNDLRIDERDGEIYVSWTPPPLGKSLLFQTDKAPAAGADDLLAVAALPGAGLSPDRRLPMPDRLVDGRLTVGPVVDPPGWSRTHYAVAVVAGNQAIVGRSVARSRAEAITNAVILERVDHQLIVFDWPGSAVQVDVFLASPGSSFEPSKDQLPHATIDEQNFEKRGGIVLGSGDEPGTGRALRKPCRVYLVPATFEAGDTIPTKPIACDYPGLVRIGYRLDVSRAGLRSKGRTAVSATCEIESPLPLAMALVWRKDRLPLHREDGTTLAQVRTPLTTTMQAVMDVDQTPPVSGFVRLFVLQPSNAPRLAVLDPPLGQLRFP